MVADKKNYSGEKLSFKAVSIEPYSDKKNKNTETYDTIDIEK
jgi:hypothetical protein